MRRETVAAINRRRDTVVRRKSIAPVGFQSPNTATMTTNGNGRDNPAFFNDTFDGFDDSFVSII